MTWLQLAVVPAAVPAMACLAANQYRKTNVLDDRELAIEKAACALSTRLSLPREGVLLQSGVFVRYYLAVARELLAEWLAFHAGQTRTLEVHSSPMRIAPDVVRIGLAEAGTQATLAHEVNCGKSQTGEEKQQS